MVTMTAAKIAPQRPMLARRKYIMPMTPMPNSAGAMRAV